MKVLIADDDPQLLRALRITLGAKGYDVRTAADGAEAVRVAIDEHPDLVMLDLGMPRLDGVEVIEAIRGWSATPILVVSGRTGAADKVEALDAGADDYVTKPFQIDELLARIRALTRRIPAHDADPVVTFADVRVDLAARTATKGGEPVRLTPTEWQMLRMLLRSPSRLVTRQSLLQELWGTHRVRDTGSLRLYVSQLRKKLEPEPAHPRHLLTEAGMGYRFEPGTPPPVDAPGDDAGPSRA